MILNPTTRAKDNTTFCVELAILQTKYSRYHISFLSCTIFGSTSSLGPELTVGSPGCDIHYMNSSLCVTTSANQVPSKCGRMLPAQTHKKKKKVSSCTMPKKNITVLLGLVVGNKSFCIIGGVLNHSCNGCMMCLTGLQPTITLFRHQCPRTLPCPWSQ